MKRMKIIVALILAACLIPGMAMAELKLAKHIDSLKLKGDLRVRFERHDQDKDANNAPGTEDTNNPKDRLRSRFRLGAFWKAPDEKWEVGAGLCTGKHSSTSTNDTWSYRESAKKSETFDSGDLRLDYAYAKHSLNIAGLKKANIILGQQKNPFQTSWLLWDSDVRPAGFTGHADFGMAFVTLGVYDFIQNDNDLGMMTALQAGAKIKNGNISFLGALTGYFYNNTPFLDDGGPPYDFEYLKDANGDYILDADDRKIPVSWDDSTEYKYNIIDLYGKVDIAVDKKVKISPYIQLFTNIGADGDKGEGYLPGDLEPDSENMGWVLGVKAKINKASFKLSYAQVGADSCIPDLKNADFGSSLNDGVNVKGAVVALGYKITKHFSTELTAYLYEPLTDEAIYTEDGLRKTDQRNMSMYHIDMKYKF